jgi:hypothetical protein
MMSFRHNLVNRALSARGVENFPRRALTEATELDSQLALADVIIGLNPVALGFSRPVQVTHAGDGSGRLFVVEQEGNIRIIKNGVVLPTPFLNIQTSVLCCGERGLLGLAFLYQLYQRTAGCGWRDRNRPIFGFWDKPGSG